LRDFHLYKNIFLHQNFLGLLREGQVISNRQHSSGDFALRPAFIKNVVDTIDLKLLVFKTFFNCNACLMGTEAVLHFKLLTHWLKAALDLKCTAF
jgi:hypothetical protein